MENCRDFGRYSLRARAAFGSSCYYWEQVAGFLQVFGGFLSELALPSAALAVSGNRQLFFTGFAMTGAPRPRTLRQRDKSLWNPTFSAFFAFPHYCSAFMLSSIMRMRSRSFSPF